MGPVVHKQPSPTTHTHAPHPSSFVLDVLADLECYKLTFGPLVFLFSCLVKSWRPIYMLVLDILFLQVFKSRQLLQAIQLQVAEITIAAVFLKRYSFCISYYSCWHPISIDHKLAFISFYIVVTDSDYHLFTCLQSGISFRLHLPIQFLI